jgi:putative ABC transport system permease protein
VFQEFISWPTLLQTSRKQDLLDKKWNSTTSQSQLFVKLSPTASLENIQQELDKLAKDHEDANSKKYGQETHFDLQALSDLHFDENYGLFDWSAARTSKSLLYNLALVALFLLLLGCINFINLNTAQATQRAKEIGIRKTLGSSRKQLIWQFIGETFLLVLISALLSFVLTKWLLEVFSDFVPNGLEFELITSPVVIIGILLLLAVVTFLSGFYPAMVLSRFNAVSVLKNNLTLGDKRAKLRKTLTVFQFAIAQVFIIGTLIVGKQINYLLSEDMGFKTESVVTVYQPITSRDFSKLELFGNEIKTVPEVEESSLIYNPPASNNSNITDFTRKVDSIERYKEVFCLYGDTNYIDVFDINLLAGTDRKNDTIREIVINETAMKEFGFENPQAAIGEFLDDYDGDPVPIVGVMADFHLSSLHMEIPPTVLIGDWYRPEWHQFQAVSMTLRSDKERGLSTGVSNIEAVYNKIYPDTDMRLEFMDETIESFYNREKKISKLLKWATGLSILISCLGLLGLVIFTTNRRVKEIGVRKVLGASVFQINMLLCKEFLILVGIAFVVAAPIAYYGTYEWLQDFSYKIGISWWIFLVSGMAMIAIALLAMSVRTLHAASANPVNSLRSE